MKTLILSVVLGLIAAPTEAGQPISESFTECAVLYDTSNRWFPKRRGSEKGAALDCASAAMMEGAAREAAREGRGDVARYLARVEASKIEKWDRRDTTLVFTQEFRDWMGYCGKLAESRGISLK